MTDFTGTPLGGFEQRLLGELREIVAQRSPEARSRKRLPRTIVIAPRRRLARWATVSAAVVGAVVVVLVVGTSGGGPASAFAGWSASPTTPGDGQLQAAESACQQRNPDLASVTPTVTDTRGPDSLLVYAESGTTTTCVTGQVQLGTVALTHATGDSLAASGSITPQSIGLEFAADGQAFREMTGQLAADVTAVTVVLEGGSSVVATVANGWFAAWWPVSQDFESGQALALSLSQSIPRSFEVTTATRTTTQPLTQAEIQNALQAPKVDGSYAALGSSGATGSTSATGASGSTGDTGTTRPGTGGSTGTAPPGIDPALWASFALFRQPGPSPVPLPEGIAGAYTGPAQPPNPYSVNPNFAQYVASANTWVLPGASGVCSIVIGIVGPPPIGSGSCAPTSLALAGDYFDDWHGRWDSAHPRPVTFIHEFTLIGLAPDGNTTVTVTEADGSTRQVPVADNIYEVVGGDPTSITLRDASGAPTTVPIPATGG